MKGQRIIPLVDCRYSLESTNRGKKKDNLLLGICDVD